MFAVVSKQVLRDAAALQMKAEAALEEEMVGRSSNAACLRVTESARAYSSRLLQFEYSVSDYRKLER